uniref:Uncharacterized protein n=1 Tax=Mycena chlorophos TaxID=658473 RepID=A0ABQ0KXD2_MYCCL|nr:predicted protein [Mycena chlorophos]
MSKGGLGKVQRTYETAVVGARQKLSSHSALVALRQALGAETRKTWLVDETSSAANRSMTASIPYNVVEVFAGQNVGGDIRQIKQQRICGHPGPTRTRRHGTGIRGRYTRSSVDEQSVAASDNPLARTSHSQRAPQTVEHPTACIPQAQMLRAPDCRGTDSAPVGRACTPMGGF